MEKYLVSIMGSYVDHCFVSDTYPAEGDFSHARFMGDYPGGCPLNVAAVCAMKDTKVYALDMLSDKEMTTPYLLKQMEGFGIDTSHIQIKTGVTNGQVIIILTGDLRTMFVVDPIRPYYEVDQKMKDLFNNATYIYSLMHMIDRSFENLDPLLEAKKNGAKIVLDGTSKYDDPSRVKILYDLTSGLFINETDYQRLKDNSYKEPRDIIFENGGEFVIITRGSEGADLYLKDKTIHKPSVQNVNVTDSTGAGDSFAGCFMACLLKGMDYETALSYATVNGAYCCTVFSGSGGAADMATIETFAKEHNYEL